MSRLHYGWKTIFQAIHESLLMLFLLKTLLTDVYQGQFYYLEKQKLQEEAVCRRKKLQWRRLPRRVLRWQPPLSVLQKPISL